VKKNNTGLFIITVWLFLLSFHAYASSDIKISKADTVSGVFKIMKIKHVENGYILNLCDEKNNYWYSVVSLKEKIKKCPKIKVGKSYNLVLKPYYEETYFPYLGMLFDIELNGKKIIVPSETWTSNVYTSQNLKGLYYISPSYGIN